MSDFQSDVRTGVSAGGYAYGLTQARGGTAIAGAMQAQKVASEPLPGVPSALAGALATTSDLAVAIGILAERLERAGVLRPGRAEASGPNAAPPPNFMCSLANSVDNQRVTLQGLIAVVSDLQDRLDV